MSLMAPEISLMCLKVFAILRCAESDESDGKNMVAYSS